MFFFFIAIANEIQCILSEVPLCQSKNTVAYLLLRDKALHKDAEFSGLPFLMRAEVCQLRAVVCHEMEGLFY